MSIEEFIEEYVVNADRDLYESDVDRVGREEDVAEALNELKALREQVKAARELTLNEVAAYLRAESNRYLGADEHHERAEAFHVAAEEVAAGQFRATPADPELEALREQVKTARLEGAREAFKIALANDWYADDPGEVARALFAVKFGEEYKEAQ